MIGVSQKVKITLGTHDGSTVSDYNLDGNGYITLENSNISGINVGYISKMKVTPYGRFPIELFGTESTYETDIVAFYSTSIGYVSFGSDWRRGFQSGILSFNLGDSTSTTGAGVGIAISYKPKVKID